MIDKLASAFDKQDYKTAAKLLKQLLKDSPQDSWVQFYLGRYHEVSGKHDKAEEIFRRLLRDATNNKLVTQARQGLQRLQDTRKAERNQAIASAKSDPANIEPGVLILEPLLNNEEKTLKAQKFAEIMQIDPYTARLILPSRGWRSYKTGAIGELEFFGSQLLSAGIPCFWAKISKIQQIQVFQAENFQEYPLHKTTSQTTLICRNSEKQQGSITFNWSEVTARVSGLIPIFEEVVDVNARRKLERKTQTLDYFHFCDLHLPSRNCILRLYDNGYKFDKAIKATSGNKATITNCWNNLLEWLEKQTPQTKAWSDFTPFAETVLDQTELLKSINSHLDISRPKYCPWDTAFHLYSGLVFVKTL